MQYIEPKRLREANIQAELYGRLKELGINCYLEYPYFAVGCKRRFRADAAIYKNNSIVCFVEVKSRRRPSQPNWFSKQLQHYRSTGLYVVVCDNFNFEESITKIQELYHRFD
jgi:hypothetical protein